MPTETMGLSTYIYIKIYLSLARILQTVDVLSPSDLNYSWALVDLTPGYTTNVKARNKIIQIS